MNGHYPPTFLYRLKCYINKFEKCVVVSLVLFFEGIKKSSKFCTIDYTPIDRGWWLPHVQVIHCIASSTITADAAASLHNRPYRWWGSSVCPTTFGHVEDHLFIMDQGTYSPPVSGGLLPRDPRFLPLLSTKPPPKKKPNSPFVGCASFRSTRCSPTNRNWRSRNPLKPILMTADLSYNLNGEKDDGLRWSTNGGPYPRRETWITFG